MAHKVEAGDVAKAQMDFGNTFMLAMLVGAFIGIGAMFSTVVGTDTRLGCGLTRLLIGLAFCLGLILVVGGGAELFTGNNLLVMTWAHGKVGTTAVPRNWAIVYVGSFIGAVATALGFTCQASGRWMDIKWARLL